MREKSNRRKKKVAGYLHRTATTAYPCYLPILGEFSRSWPYKTCRCKYRGILFQIECEGKILQIKLIFFSHEENKGVTTNTMIFFVFFVPPSILCSPSNLSVEKQNSVLYSQCIRRHGHQTAGNKPVPYNYSPYSNGYPLSG